VNSLDEFQPARDSIDWAREAIQEIDAFTKSFFSPQNMTHAEEFDPATGLKQFKIKSREPVPKAVRRKATEALNNLKHSFDQSIFGACRAVKQPRRKINFPWARNPTDLERLLENRQVPAEFWETIRRHEPYPRGDGYSGGDDILRELAHIANGKHTIGLRVGANIAAITFTHAVFTGPLDIPANSRWDPVKNEMIIATGSADSNFQGQYNFAAYISLNEAGALRDVSLEGVLSAFLDKANKVADDLEAACIAAIGA
jgi:hypothetical protein